jgi:hypothetical protein
VTEGDLVKLTINGDMKMDNQNKRNLDYTMSGYVDNVKYRDFSVDRICAHYKEMGILTLFALIFGLIFV